MSEINAILDDLHPNQLRYLISLGASTNIGNITGSQDANLAFLPSDYGFCFSCNRELRGPFKIWELEIRHEVWEYICASCIPTSAKAFPSEAISALLSHKRGRPIPHLDEYGTLNPFEFVNQQTLGPVEHMRSANYSPAPPYVDVHRPSRFPILMNSYSNLHNVLYEDALCFIYQQEFEWISKCDEESLTRRFAMLDDAISEYPSVSGDIISQIIDFQSDNGMAINSDYWSKDYENLVRDVINRYSDTATYSKAQRTYWFSVFDEIVTYDPQ